jgi:hypothetical protein
LTVFQISFEILEEEGTDVLGHAEISLSHRWMLVLHVTRHTSHVTHRSQIYRGCTRLWHEET